jgi:hypothetical protein
MTVSRPSQTTATTFDVLWQAQAAASYIGIFGSLTRQVQRIFLATDQISASRAVFVQNQTIGLGVNSEVAELVRLHVFHRDITLCLPSIDHHTRDGPPIWKLEIRVSRQGY